MREIRAALQRQSERAAVELIDHAWRTLAHVGWGIPETTARAQCSPMRLPGAAGVTGKVLMSSSRARSVRIWHGATVAAAPLRLAYFGLTDDIRTLKYHWSAPQGSGIVLP